MRVENLLQFVHICETMMKPSSRPGNHIFKDACLPGTWRLILTNGVVPQGLKWLGSVSINQILCKACHMRTTPGAK